MLGLMAFERAEVAGGLLGMLVFERAAL
jgi:hypothetical protein